MKTLNILIIDGLNRSGLAVVRALKMADKMADEYNIHVVAHSEKFRNIFRKKLKSNAIDTIHFVENEYHNIFFIDELIQIVIECKIDVIIPIGQASAMSVSRSKVTLSEYCKVLIEDFENMIKFHDKSKTVLIARKLHIPHPFTIFPKDINHITSYAVNATYPVVIKARKGSGSTGVWYAKNSEELIKLYKNVSEQSCYDDGFIHDSSNPILQEYIPGELHDALVFCVNGEIKVGLTQKRIITRPLSGGFGIVNITTHEEALLHYAHKIARHTKWNGILMFDFKIDDRDGQPKLLEVNPRFWGTTWLSICAGINFPHYLVLDAYSESIAYPQNYKTGLICRWVLDELGVIFDSPRTFLTMIARAKGFISRFRYKNCAYDIILSDLKPAIGEIMDTYHRVLSASVHSAKKN